MGTQESGMAQVEIEWRSSRPQVVGSFGSGAALAAARPEEVAQACDLAEIRLDVLAAEGWRPGERPWESLAAAVPLLFTARRREEGGVLEGTAGERAEWLAAVLDDAALVDVEVASLEGMAEVLREIRRRGMPWVASFHDFSALPADAVVAESLARAMAAGATIFKLAARLHTPGDVARLADFQRGGHPLAVSAMGMGALAPVSRLLCAQCGSVLNYGFLGATPTAPGQWDAGLLKAAIGRLAPLGAA